MSPRSEYLKGFGSLIQLKVLGIRNSTGSPDKISSPFWKITLRFNQKYLKVYRAISGKSLISGGWANYQGFYMMSNVTGQFMLDIVSIDRERSERKASLPSRRRTQVDVDTMEWDDDWLLRRKTRHRSLLSRWLKRLESVPAALVRLLCSLCRHEAKASRRSQVIKEESSSESDSFSDMDDSETLDTDTVVTDDVMQTPTSYASTATESSFFADSPESSGKRAPMAGDSSSSKTPLRPFRIKSNKVVPLDLPLKDLGTKINGHPPSSRIETPVTRLLYDCYGGHKGESSAADLHPWALFVEKRLIHPDAPMKTYWDMLVGAIVVYSVSPKPLPGLISPSDH